MESVDKVIIRLREEKFKLTPQRISVIRYLVGNKKHPSAMKIYSDLKRKHPGLSFSTVYNTLKVLEHIGELTALNVNDDHQNFDPDTSLHHHFLCKVCGNIIDIPASEEEMKESAETIAGGHRVESVRKDFKGVCSSCL